MEKLNLQKILSLCIAVLSLVAVIMIFVPAVKADSMLGTSSYNGLKVVFGHKEEGMKLFSFSFLNLLTYLLALAVLVCGLLSFKKEDKVLSIVVCVLAVLTAVFFLLTKNFVVFPKELKDIKKEFVEAYDLGAGPIVGTIMMFLAAAASGAKVALTVLKKD